MSLADTLIPAGVGLVVGLVPFGYTVVKDKRERRERDEMERRRELEHQRERLTAAATRYLDLLGKAMVLLEAIRVDAENADELLSAATNAIGELQGQAQGDLLVTFGGASSPVVWADRACRRIVNEALTIATDGRAHGQTGEEAFQTRRAVQELTSGGIDPVHGPRDLFRWATGEAIKKWPEPLTHFEDPWQRDARMIADSVHLDLPAELVATSQEQP